MRFYFLFLLILFHALPSHPSPLNQAMALYHEGLEEDATPLLEEALKTLPDLGDIRLLLAELYLKKEELEKAKRVLLPLMQEGSCKKEEASFLCGLIAKKEKDWKEAERFFSHYSGIEGEIESAFALYRQKGDEEAKKRLISLKDHPLARLYLEEISLEEKEKIAAFTAVKEKVEAALKEKGSSLATSAREAVEELFLNANLLSFYPKEAFAEKLLFMKGALLYKEGNIKEAHALFTSFVEQFPSSSLTGEALYWMALSGQKERRPAIWRRIIEEYPDSRYGGEAYYSLYSPLDYLQGDRAAMKHLQAMKERYPNSPFLLNADYLIGLDFKRDRKTAEGKWIRKRNMTAAIDAFVRVEQLYEALEKEGHFLEEERLPFLSLRYRATLERALANLSIASESEGAKKEVYLEYTEEVLQEILYDLESPDHPLTASPLQQEAAHWLIHTYLEEKKEAEADALASKMIAQYEKGAVDYYLSRFLYQRGKSALARGEALSAYQFFNQAEEAAKGGLLSTDETLDLWIQQSNCCREMKSYSDAMRLLSKVINEDVISSLRLKAMFLRAAIYEEEGRYDLAKKQLEALAKKGGTWAKQAKEKLAQEKQEYPYDR